MVAEQSEWWPDKAAGVRIHRKAAALKNPAPSLALYSKLAQSQEETTRFMDVLAGTLAFKEYFAPSNISRLLGLGTRIVTARPI